MTRRYYAVLAKVSLSYSPLQGRLVTCYSPVRHCTQVLLPFLVRLACVRHAASVDSEPGSNSRLKPDACRRVVGRLPSPHIRSQLAKADSGFNSAGWRRCSASPPSCEGFEDHSGLSCEIVSDLCPNPFSHDWHVQPSCQRPNRLPPERRAFRSRRTRY